jgi:hypothetical protein
VLADGVDVGLVVGRAVVRNRELAVRGGGSTVTIRQIIDNQLGCGVVSTNVVFGHWKTRDLRRQDDLPAYGGLAPALLAARIWASVLTIRVSMVTFRSSHWKLGTLATAAALVAMAPVMVGMARVETSEA